MRRRATEARVVRVATYDDRGQIHLVPVTFVLDGDRLYSPSDAGPRRAKRLRNLEDDARVAVLIDGGPEYERARQLLDQKYPQFRDAPPDEAAGPIMAHRLDRVGIFLVNLLRKCTAHTASQ